MSAVDAEQAECDGNVSSLVSSIVEERGKKEEEVTDERRNSRRRGEGSGVSGAEPDRECKHRAAPNRDLPGKQAVS